MNSTLPQHHEDGTDSRQRVTALLHFAKKAGQIVYGFDAVVKQIHKNRVCLLLLATDLSGGTQGKIRKIAQGKDVILWGDMELYYQIMQKHTGILAITSENFKHGIKDAINAMIGK